MLILMKYQVWKGAYIMMVNFKFLNLSLRSSSFISKGFSHEVPLWVEFRIFGSKSSFPIQNLQIRVK